MNGHSAALFPAASCAAISSITLRPQDCKSGSPIQLVRKMVLHDWTSSAQISLESGMRKARQVVPITQGKQQTPPSALTFFHQEFRILTCRQTLGSFSFHLGPPLFLRSRAINHQPGKILPFLARRPEPANK
jgi:hypothetical protein